MAPSVVSFCKELIEVQEARHLERSIMVDFNNNFIPLSIVGNDNFLRGYSIYHTAFPINEIETVQTTNLQLQLSRSIGFLFFIDRLKTIGTFADSWPDLGSDSSSSALTFGSYILIMVSQYLI